LGVLYISETLDDRERFPDYFRIGFDEVLFNPLHTLKIKQKIEGANIICLDCQKRLNRKGFEFLTEQQKKDYSKVSFKFGKDSYTIKCGCGCIIFYPPRKNRGFAYAKRYVTSEEFKASRDRVFREI